MRKRSNTQPEFFCQPSHLKITKVYRRIYEAIAAILDANMAILDRVHEDLKRASKRKRHQRSGRKCSITSETLLRILICQLIEGESLRGIVIRIDDSNFLRWFVRIYNAPMIDYTRLCALKNAIRPKTWKKINDLLAQWAVENGKVDGQRLRIDTTAYETNIHWPTDSSLLWDTYRVISRIIARIRDLEPCAASGRRLHPKRAKRLHTKIARLAGRGEKKAEAVKDLYFKLITQVSDLLAVVPEVISLLRFGLRRDVYDMTTSYVLMALLEELEHYRQLGMRVVDQAQRRVLQGEQVPNAEKLFSIFEPHTELLKRGKANKPVEFGHMVVFQQVENKFITDYNVFDQRPVDHALVDPALESHRRLFGGYPEEFSGDKGFYESTDKLRQLEEHIDTVSICKLGSRTDEEKARERSAAFKLGQQFRAGIEGSISVLKRALGMWRCLNKGWQHFVSTVGTAVFTHNLLVLARAHAPRT